MHNGKYIVIDGIAPARTAMVAMLARQLQMTQIPPQIVDTADQSHPSIHTIQQLMQDPSYPLHSRTEVLLYNAIRAQSAEITRAAKEQGRVCLSSQSYLSTLVMQYYGTGDITNYNAASTIVQFAAGSVQPDLHLILDTQANIVGSQQMDTDVALLERLRAGYLWEARQHNIPVLYATDDLDALFRQVWNYVAQILGIRSDVTLTTAIPSDLSEPPLATTEADKPAISPTAAPNTDPVAVTPVTTSAESKPAPEPMPSETSVTVNETAEIRLTPPENVHISIFATENLAPSTIATNLQNSLVQNPYEHKDAQGHYRYYIPEALKGKVRSQYIRTMNQQFSAYSELFASLSAHLRTIAGTPKPKRDAAWEERLATKTRQLLQPILPLAATTSVQIAADRKDALLTEFESDPLAELQNTGRQLVSDDRSSQSISSALSSANTTTTGDKNSANTPEQLANEFLPAGYTFATNPVTLVEYYPRNELDLVAELLYPYSDLPLQTLRSEVTGWPYERKIAAITSAVLPLVKAGKPFTGSSYTFDLLTDYATYRSLRHNGFGTATARQGLSPRYGYTTSRIIEDAGLSGQIDNCFDRSLELYSALQSSGQPDLVSYALLMGHQVRWRTTCTLDKVTQLHSSIRFASEMLEKIAEVHPLVSDIVRNPKRHD